MMMLLSFVIFLAIVIIFPITLVDDRDNNFCEDGHLWAAHGSFVLFILLLTLFEASALRSLKKRLK